jgi:peptidoglycan/LPS O-acetylase OafA/YrhL
LKDSGRFSFVDALRGLASLSVVIFHAYEGNHLTDLAAQMPSWLIPLLFQGNIGVPIFFVLSGFVIAYSLRDRAMTPANVGRFMFKRSIRLDPPYWVAIAVSIGFSVLAAAVIKGRSQEQFSIIQIVAHLCYAQDILGLNDINIAFWTLCLEVQFYFVFALLLLLPRWTFFLAFTISLLWPLGIPPPLHQGLFPSLWYGFLLGVLAYWAWNETRLIPAFAVYVGLIAISGALRADTFAITCAITSTILLAVGLRNNMTIWNWRWLQFLGTISYSLYLLHNPITGAVFRAGFLLTGRTAMTEAIWWPVSLACCIFAASALWYWVERPCTSLARRITINSTPL